MSIFSSPIGRLAFLARVLPPLLLMVGGVILSIAKQNLDVITICVLLSILATIYIVGFAIFPRLTSVGMSRWFALLYFVPALGLPFIIFLLFCPSGQFGKHDNVA